MALLPLPLVPAIPANGAINGAPGSGLPSTPLPRLGRVPRRRALLGLGGAFALAAAVLLAPQAPAQAGSALLDRVKQNPKVAVAICAELRSLNAQGITSTNPQAVNRIAAMQGLGATDAEILTTYVVGLHCPDVR